MQRILIHVSFADSRTLIQAAGLILLAVIVDLAGRQREEIEGPGSQLPY